MNGYPDPFPPFVPSRRHTTSSRKPGVDVQGTVRIVAVPLIRCDNCGTKWRGGTVHGYRMTGDGSMCEHGVALYVDCVGAPAPSPCLHCQAMEGERHA